MQPDNIIYSQQTNIGQNDNRKLKVSKVPVFVTLGATVFVVVGLSMLVAFLTHPEVSPRDSDNVPVELVPSEKIDALDVAVGQLLGVSMQKSSFETSCALVQNINNCEKWGQGVIYGLVYDHQILDSEAHAFVRIGSDANAVYDRQNYENFSLYKMIFRWDGDKYVYIETKNIID